MKKSFKTIVSVILSLTFIFSYLNLMSNDVSADTATVNASISEGVVYTSSDYNDNHYFTPSKSGYYYFEGQDWVDVYEVTVETDEYTNEPYNVYEMLDYLDIIPIDYPALVGDEYYQNCFYLVKGKTYAFNYHEGIKFVVRHLDRYVLLERSEDLVKATLDEPFTLSITATSSVSLDNISYIWSDIPNDENGYYGPSVTLNLSQLLDSDNHFIFYNPYEDYENCGDFGRGFVSVCVEAEYKGNTYYKYVSFDIEGYESDLSRKCQAYDNRGFYQEGFVYSELYEFGEPWEFFDVVTEQPDGYEVSLQWCKVDTARKISGNYTDESDLYIPLAGETSNYLVWNASLKNALGDPYHGDHDTDQSIYYDVVCLVTFKKGNETFTKVLNYKITFNVEIRYNGQECFDVERGSTIVMPKFVDGYFDESKQPEGITYKYTWFKCGSEPDYMGYGYSGSDPNDINIHNDIPDLELIGTGKECSINTANLSVISYKNESDGSFEYNSYVACLAQPMYKGHICHGSNFEVYCQIFELHYGSFKIGAWTSSATPCIGDELFLDVDVESIGPVTYQWQKQLDEGWINIFSSTYDTNEYWMTVDEDSFGLYRCAVTDEFGNTIYSEPCEVSLYDGPVITCEPTDFYGFVGDTAKFTVAVEGEGLTYQWQLKKGNSWADQASGGANTPTFSVKVNESRFGKTYRCKITDQNGHEIFSNEVMIIEKEVAIVIDQQPVDCTAVVGTTAKFSVAATGEGLTYQWQLKKGNSWANQSSGGATTPNFSVKAEMSRNGKVYRCLITAANGDQIATDPVTLTVKEPSITITQQPTDCTALVGSKAKFTVAAEGEGLTYQWQLKKGSSWANQNSGGATTPTFSVNADLSRNGKTYRCLITNAEGEQIATNSVTLTVKEPSNSIIITKQPTDASTTEGGSVGFIVEAEGEGLTYQWQLKKGSSWSDLHSGGATTNWLSLGKCDLSKNGKTYRCVITDVNGEQAVTNEVKVTVWYEMPSAVPAVKSAAPAVADDAVADTVTEPDPETVNEAPAPVETPAEETAPAPVEAIAPAPVEEPAPVPADSPVDEPA